ncbi:MAG TPA: glutamate ABC transporter substrate-binding protein [Candidatus Stackebrandtia faecavium]|nr:glutamate ABC transporter substrate-binding protein [Candidatus Stackebrandtia faecavium]
MRQMRRLAFIAFLVTGMLAVSSCAADMRNTSVPTDYVIQQADRSEMPDEIKAIYDSGRLTIGSKFDQPLTGFRDEATGRITGFDAEIGRILAQRIFGEVAEGDNLFFVETVSSSREKYIQNGTVDMVVATYSMTDDRKDEVDYAGPYFTTGQAVMVDANSGIKKITDLAGKDICTVKGSESSKLIKQKAPDAKFNDPMRDYSSCKEAVLNGEADAMSTDDTILHGYATQYPDELEVLDGTLTDEKYGIGLPHNSPELRKFVNDTLEEIYENGDWKTAFSLTLETGGIEMPEEPPTLDRY